MAVTGRADMKYVYPACFYPEPDKRFSVEFADFELATFGDNLADAMYMASAAAAGRILSMLEAGKSFRSQGCKKREAG
jgi:predicted RNase H-like HicB family nuclease